jgi:uncharacterized protein (PEP-CTERM system associated)
MVVPKWPSTVGALLLIFGISNNALIAGEWQLQPGLLLDTYGYQVRQSQSGDWDKGAALAATPNVELLYDSKNLLSSLNWKQKHVFYEDEQRSDKSLDYINFSNRLSAWDNRMVWSVNASEGYRVRNSQRGVFADEITGFADLSKTSTMGTSLALSTARHTDTQASLNLTARKINSERPIISDEFGDLNNEFYAASFAIGKRRRNDEFYWQFDSRYSENIRTVGNDLKSKNVDLMVGVPLFSKLAWVNRARYESNELFTNYENEFSSIGSGLEYRFGTVSYINVTYNRYRQQQLLDESGEYWALDMLLAPTRRSHIQLMLDRRYYGRSVEVAGSYRIQHLSARLSYNERVTVINGLDQEFTDLGIFVCPGAFSGIGDCFLPPSANYQLLPGESLQNFVATDVEINERVVLRQGGAFNLAYDRRRLSLALNISRNEDEYVESDRRNRTDSLAVYAKWRLSSLVTLSSQITIYKLIYSLEQRTDENVQIQAGASFKLNDHSDISANVRRVRRSSNQEQFDLQENRVWLSYAYKF